MDREAALMDTVLTHEALQATLMSQEPTHPYMPHAPHAPMQVPPPQALAVGPSETRFPLVHPQ